MHDGFTLADLVSYVDKHNEANGEGNRDGHNNNASWNCGVEGPTDDPAINAARRRDVRALLATLFMSRGMPLIQQGDEMGRTQRGNNNAYAQDNEITWVDWENADGDAGRFRRGGAQVPQGASGADARPFPHGQDKHGVRDVVWLHPDGREMNDGDWNRAGASVLGMQLRTADDEVLVWFNRHAEAVTAMLPAGDWAVGLAVGRQGRRVAFTGNTVSCRRARWSRWSARRSPRTSRSRVPPSGRTPTGSTGRGSRQIAAGQSRTSNRTAASRGRRQPDVSGRAATGQGELEQPTALHRSRQSAPVVRYHSDWALTISRLSALE